MFSQAPVTPTMWGILWMVTKPSCSPYLRAVRIMASHTLITAMRLGSVLRLWLPTWAEARVPAATFGARVRVSISND